MASVNLTPLSPAMASTLPSLEQIQSSDYFQQMLSTDSALEALSISRSDLELKLQALTVPKGQPLSAEAAAEYDAITESIAHLEELVETFEDLQEEARHLFGLRARSLRQREIGILDMPNEVLLAIFQNFRPPLDFSTMSPYKGNNGADVKSIKSVRLTCLRFRQHSSHLLIEHLSVSLDNMSMNRLQSISSHPEISRGERILGIDLRNYRLSIAGDFRAFTALCIYKLGISIDLVRSSLGVFKVDSSTGIGDFDDNIESTDSDIETTDSDIESTDSDIGSTDSHIDSLEGSNELSAEIGEQEEDGKGHYERSRYRNLPDGMSVTNAKDGLRELQRVLSIWERFSKRDPIEELDQSDKAVFALREGHKRYRELYQQQQRLIQDGSFARAVAATAAASRSKVWLSMSDIMGPSSARHMAELEELSKSKFLSFTDPHHFDHALSYMVRPDVQEWWASGTDTPAELSQSLLYDIPVAMHTAQAKLAGLKVCVRCTAFKLDLSMSRERLLCFMEATKDLEAFKLVAKPVDDGSIYHEDVQRNLLVYAGAAMGPACSIVPHLYLDFAVGIGDILGFRLPIKALLHARNWHGLKAAVLGNFEVSLEDLEKLTDMLEPGTQLRLFETDLTSGTWAAALDCLRSKVGQGSWLSEPTGAECAEMEDEEYEEIFERQESKDGGVEESKATKYITSVEGVDNPLHKND